MKDAPIGEKRGRLTAFKEIEPHITKGGGKKRKILCFCCCGNQVEVRLAEFLSGRSQSCGCLKKEKTSLRFRKVVEGTLSKNHPLYSTWKGMKERCNNPNNIAYKHYGGRGIKVCKEWEDSFEAFVRDMGPKPFNEYTLERIDNDGGYENGNVKWADRVENTNNARSNVLITAKGKTQTATQWARETGIKASSIRDRIRRGWSHEKAITCKKRSACENPPS